MGGDTRKELGGTVGRIKRRADGCTEWKREM